MFHMTRLTTLAAIITISAFAAALDVRQVDQNQGQPVSAGRPANRTSEAAATFGTTTDSVNWTTLPKGLCIVPQYANQAGIGEEKSLTTVQQAMELCPQCTRIAVHHD
ncbi:hypothetical protein FRC09_016356 [Ceratobasidium sp. 395]|nr:hypothetical protein FRC09_016356 [Ceratobasidium sp. 395]